MKKYFSVPLLLISFALGLLMSGCGESSVADNDYLGKLPGLSDKYQREIDEYKEKARQSTDMDDAFKYEKKYKLAKEESDKVISEYVINHMQEAPIPFDASADPRYELLDLLIKGAGRTRVDLISQILVKEDLKNKYGGFEKYLFAYIKAVDKEGNTLGKPTVMASSMSNRDPYTEGMEVTISGSIGNLKYFGEFEKIVFISKEEYDKTK